ncbi:MAG: hypothetical protein EI684_04535 [Candidatus Viridilinea halotolerans]|uniref:Uncharacterized protein n=1 Tax=Candidatus Viridilinea halotolerans TaxID=2491704 RepID=A0A426U6D2_9CHLR|nr:MAG: hypothetical protein EI684_04535 [Candidatus Viridilinea halotolerans]
MLTQIQALLQQAENLEAFLKAIGSNVPLTDELRQQMNTTLDHLEAEVATSKAIVLPVSSAHLQETLASALEETEMAITLTTGGLQHPAGDTPRLGLALTRIQRAITGLQAILASLNPMFLNLPTGDGMTIVFTSAEQTYSLRTDRGLIQQVAATHMSPLAIGVDGTPYWVSIDGPIRDEFSTPPFRIMQGGSMQHLASEVLHSTSLFDTQWQEPTGSPAYLTLSRDGTQLYFDACTFGLGSSCFYYALDLNTQQLTKLSFTSVTPDRIAPDGQRALLFLDNPHWNPGSDTPGSDLRYGYFIEVQDSWNYDQLPLAFDVHGLVWLADGRFIYSGGPEDQPSQLILANHDGSTAQVLVHDLPATSLLLAPDEQQIAYVNHNSGALTLLNLATLQSTTVATLPSDAILLAWR